jgi:hypothetical protein
MTWVAWTGDCATGLPIALMATTDIPTATTMPMINCVMLLLRMIASHHLIAADYGRRVMGITRGTISERDIRRPQGQRKAPPRGGECSRQ